jgi:competence protein ComEC
MALNEKARTRAKAWDADAGRRRAGLLLPAGLADRAARLRRLLSEWALTEVAPGRLVPWIAVAFGFGVVVYFTADREPAWWAASALAFVAVGVAILARRRPVGFPLALGLPPSPPALPPRRCVLRTSSIPSCNTRFRP